MKPIIPLLVLLSVIEIVSLYYLKKYSTTSNTSNIAIGIIGYICIALLLSVLFQYGKIGVINRGWNVITSIAAFMIGYFFFKETIDFTEFMGAIVSIIGVYIMLYKTL